MLEQAVILLAEDSQDDVTLIRKGFAKTNLLNPLQVVTNGEETINYLKGEGPYSNRAEYPLPDLLLLEFENARPGRLRRIALDSPTAGSRAVTCSSPDLLGSHKDVNLAYQLGANSFLVKPVDFEHFVEMSKTLKGFWLWLSRAPETSRPSKDTISRESENHDADRSSD